LRVRRGITALVLFGALAAPLGIYAEDLNGIAETYAVGQFRTNYSASVSVSVPYRAANAAWYTNWIMFVAPVGTTPQQPMVQVGIMRWLDHGRQPSAFISYQQPGKELVYKDLGPVADVEHALRIWGDGRSVHLVVDGKVVASYPRAQFFRSNDRTYFQYGAEVKQAGDRIVGYLRDPRVKGDDDDAEHPIGVACVHSDRGLDLTETPDHRFDAAGTFIPGAPSAFRGPCKAP
jgi:hypothetical protein